MDLFRTLLLGAGILLLGSCSVLSLDGSLPSVPKGPARIMLLVEGSLADPLAPDLQAWQAMLEQQGDRTTVRAMTSDVTLQDVRALIQNHAKDYDGFFLVGQLPVAWYEQTAFGQGETFPTDLYLMAPDSIWADTDQDGVFDGHSPLEAQVYVSRLTGTLAEIQAYFRKLETYYRGLQEPLDHALVFKDNDWFSFQRGSTFGLERLYSLVDVNQDLDNTTRQTYVDRMSTVGAEYVYQWIHASPATLYIYQDRDYDLLRRSDIAPLQIKGRFHNLFNCKGSRFTEPNLGMTYLTGTDTGLAVTGSTKVGGNWYPLEFHRSLALGATWGQAFINWYNHYGVSSDEWFLGMTILGDPSLRLSGEILQDSRRRALTTDIIPPSASDLEVLARRLVEHDLEHQ